MEKSPRNEEGKRREFLRSIWFFAAVLVILIGSSAYILIRLYGTSVMLVEANEQSFSQQARAKVSVLNEYLSLTELALETLANSRLLYTYYHNKALGMSLEYGLSLSLSQINMEFKRYVETLTDDGLPVFTQIFLFDLEEQRVIASAGPVRGPAEPSPALMKEIRTNLEQSAAFASVCDGSTFREFLVRSFRYKGSQKGYLLLELNLESIHRKLALGAAQTIDNFTGLITSHGTLIIGPSKLVGMNIHDILGTSQEALKDFQILSVEKNPAGAGSEPLAMVGAKLTNTGLSLVTVAPRSQYLGSHSQTLWTLVFVFGMGGLLLMLGFIFKGYTDRYAMYLELEDSRDNLERRVQDRTADLAETNLLLERQIAKRKKMEEDLRESEEKYREFAEFLPQLVFEIDLEGRFSFANRSGLKAVGYTPDDLVGGVRAVDIIVPEDRERVARHISGITESENVGGVQCRVLRKDGSSFPVVIHSAPTIRGGTVGGVRGVCVDLTELKSAEESMRRAQEELERRVEERTAELREAYETLVLEVTQRRRAEASLLDRERFLSDIFESIQDGIIVLDTELNIIRVNPTMEEWYAHARPLAGKKCYEVYGNQGVACDACPSLTTLKTGNSCSGSIPRQGPRGETVGWLNLFSFPLRDRETGRIKGVIDYVRDVTESKSLEDQLRHAQKMEAVGTLAGGIAHDFNNLLTIISGYTELILADKNAQDPDYADLKAIQKGAARGADLVRQILTLSRKAEPQPRLMDFNNQVRLAEKLLSKTIPRMIQISTFLADDLRTINADPAQMEQILLNLAVNARDAMPEGGELVIQTENIFLDEAYCALHAGVRPGDYVLLTVSDTGCGMDRETVNRIFEPFYTTKKAGEGTGLGLAMVFGTVKSHGGHIRCYSEPGRGTAFNSRSAPVGS